MKARKKYGFEPEYAIPPGETLKELMHTLHMSQQELAKRLDLTVQTLNRIFKGEQPITYETANRLEMVTGTPARVWNNLEMQYQEQLSKKEELKRLEFDLDWLKTIPVTELKARGLVSDQKDKIVTLHEVLSFYGVSNVDAWRKIWDNPKVAARRSSCFETQLGAASAWIRQGELSALGIQCDQFERSVFKKNLFNIRSLTIKKPEEFVPDMVKLCANAGVAFVFVREMKKVPWNGATKWLSPNKVMIQLSLRGKGEDKFWFSFFHEAGHVLYGSTKHLYVADGSNDPAEVEADKFAADFLTPESNNSRIANSTTKDDILNIASELDVAPGIVAGRYQYLTNRWSYFTNLIRRFDWKEKL